MSVKHHCGLALGAKDTQWMKQRKFLFPGANIQVIFAPANVQAEVKSGEI